MEIAEIKAALTLQKILTHYHLTPDRNARLHCPFHPDKTPSLQLYPVGARLSPRAYPPPASGGFKKANRSATDKSKAKRAERRGALGSFSLQK